MMKLTKSLVKKGGKKSLKKSLKMRKSKKGGKKSLKNRKMRKTMKGGEEKIAKGGLAEQYKKVYDYYHSEGRTLEEKTNAVGYIDCFLQPRVISAKDTIDNVSHGQSESLKNFVVKPEFVGVEGNPAVSMGNSLSIINVLDDLKITDDPGKKSVLSFGQPTQYKLYSTYMTGEAYPPKWNPEQNYKPLDAYSGCPDETEISGGKKSLNTKKARKSRKMKGGELTMEDPPKEGECIKKGITGLHTYKVVEVYESNGFGPPTVVATNSSGKPYRFRLVDMVRCVAK